MTIDLNNEVSILLMKKDNNGKSLKKLNEDIIALLTKEFGGTTILSSKGTWIDNGIIYTDESECVKCSYAQLSTSAINALYTSIKKEFTEGGQRAVSVTFNGLLTIFEQSDLNNLENEITKRISSKKAV